MSGRPVISDSVLASSVLPTPAGPSMSTGRPLRAARHTTVDTRRLAMYRASRNRCWTSSTDSNMMAPFTRTDCSPLYQAHPRRGRPAGRWVQCHMADADRYHRLQLWLGPPGSGLSLAYLVALLLTGAGHTVALWAARITPAAWAQVALVTLALGLAHGALGMPVTLARGVCLPRRYRLAHKPPPPRRAARGPSGGIPSSRGATGSPPSRSARGSPIA